MRTSIVIALAAAAAAAPALAAPSPAYSAPAKRSEFTARELADVFARAGQDDVLARSFGSDFVQGFKKGFVGTLETVGPLALSFLKREDLEMLARSDDDLLSRSFGSDFVEGFKKGFVGTLETVGPLALSFLKREDMDKMAHQALFDHWQQSGHLDERSFGSDFVDGFKKGFVGTLKTVGPLVLGFLKREDLEMLARGDHDELLARSFGSDFVDGFKKGFVGTLKTVGPLALGFLKREDLELLARDYPETHVARSINDLD